MWEYYDKLRTDAFDFCAEFFFIYIFFKTFLTLPQKCSNVLKSIELFSKDNSFLNILLPLCKTVAFTRVQLGTSKCCVDGYEAGTNFKTRGLH